MSQHPLPSPPVRRGRRSFDTLCVFTAIAGLASAADPLGPATAAKPPADPGLSDVMLARSALTAVDADADLRGVNLVVSVVDRVAVIGGPVPSAQLSRRAEQVVGAVPGILEVRNTCFIATGPDPLMRSVAKQLASPQPPRPTAFALPGVLTNDLTPAGSAVEPPNPNAIAAKPTDETVTTFRLPTPAAGTVGLLGAPVAPAGIGTASSAVAPVATVAPAATPGQLTASANPRDVLAAVAEVQKAEARFARLTVELRDGVVQVGGSAPRAADAWDFARKLRSIPGVTRIAVGAVAVN
jgi:osmotically-inducible protein OsmY